MRAGIGILSFLSLLVAATAYAPDASACGGCFSPQPAPGEQQSIVTDHRMILSVGQAQTTLYDQIQYQGDPKSFAWVLPISGTVDVGLSADTLFTTIHSLTATVVQAPPTNCPSPPSNCSFGEDNAAGAATGGGGFADAGAPPAPGVDVTKREVVGPYETVQLHPHDTTDAAALTDWLDQNGFIVPADVKPIIGAYVSEHFDFLALKLVPGQGVQAMRPVRVTTTGASIALPLRMVAAGAAANVGITLWVVGEGRYEPQNFPWFQIKSEDLTWDWTTGASDYKSIRAAKEAAASNSWEIESSINSSASQIENAVRGYASMPTPGGGSDYAPVTDANGNETKSADQVREDDFTTLFAGIKGDQARITRIRADLAHSALSTDLVMIASADQATLANIRSPLKEANQPQCPVYEGCNQVGTAPRDQAIAQSNAGSNGESFSCKTTAKKDDSGLSAIAGLAALLGLVFVRSRKKGGV
jgi:hypothetical protein